MGAALPLMPFALKVLSFNVRYGAADDGPNSWEFRRDAAASVLAESSADVICLQEALDFQNRDLHERLPGYQIVGVGRDDGMRLGEHCSLLVRDTLEVRDSGTFWFSESPDVPGSRSWEASHPRICTWAAFDRFSLYNLHIDHESQRAREESVAMLLARVTTDRPAIVAGDFNAGESNPAIQAMRDRGFRDSYRVIHADLEPSGTYHGYGDSAYPDKIDFIWVSKEWQVIDASILRDRAMGRFPSDHHPVAATVSLP
ncbi:MAG TPA: endonuclease/exonuclease/phosphatase family protein [Fimbriimonas sp.]